MKLFLLISALIVISTAHHGGPSAAEFQEARQECFKSVHVPEDIQKQIKKFEYPDSEVVHHYLRCAVIKLGLWSDTTGFIMEKVLDVLEENHPDNVLRNKINRCFDQNQQQSDKNAWAYKEFICFAHAGILGPIKGKF